MTPEDHHDLQQGAEMPTFISGQKVICVNAKMEGCGPALDEGRIYTVRKFTIASGCDEHPANWKENGGRVELMELPGGSGAGFYPWRFKGAKE